MVLSLLAGIVLLLLLIMTARALMQDQSRTPVRPKVRTIEAQGTAAVLRSAVQCKTISHLDPTQTD